MKRAVKRLVNRSDRLLSDAAAIIRFTRTPQFMVLPETEQKKCFDRIDGINIELEEIATDLQRINQ